MSDDISTWATALGTALAGLGLFQTARNARADAKATTYSTLDDMYRELLALAVEKPFLRNPKLTTGYPDSMADDQRIAYEAYAFSIWNFIETIYDRAVDYEDLKLTWEPVARSENRLHRRWFDSPDSQGKFKDDFRERVTGNSDVFPPAPKLVLPAKAS
jgi:hypothetical protein